MARFSSGSRREPPVFIQLAISAGGMLYALDEDGGVWRYDAVPGVWARLSARREVG